MKLISSLFSTIALLWLAAECALGQQTIYNVPSADVLESATVYFETDQYFRPWKTESGRSGNFFMRGVVGVGYNVELGINVGPFDYLRRSNPFIDFAAKWKPFSVEFGDEKKPGALGIYVGNHAGVGLRKDVEGDFRDFLYGAASLKLPVLQTRLGVGPYFARRRVFDDRSRGGVLATFEQPVSRIDGLLFAADWFSGRGGSATVGFIYNKDPFTFYLGHGLANTGRKDDLVTFEVGFTMK